MSAAVAAGSLQPVAGSSPQAPQQGNLQSRSVQVIKVEGLNACITPLKRGLQQREVQVEGLYTGVLCAVAGVVMLLAFVSIMICLNAFVPATFVWPGVSKLLVALGLTGLSLGGIAACAKAGDLFNKAKNGMTATQVLDRWCPHPSMAMYNVDFTVLTEDAGVYQPPR